MRIPGNSNPASVTPSSKPTLEQPEAAMQGCPDISVFRVPDDPLLPLPPAPRPRTRSRANTKGRKASSMKGRSTKVFAAPPGARTSRKKTKKRPPRKLPGKYIPR